MNDRTSIGSDPAREAHDEKRTGVIIATYEPAGELLTGHHWRVVRNSPNIGRLHRRAPSPHLPKP